MATLDKLKSHKANSESALTKILEDFKSLCNIFYSCK